MQLLWQRITTMTAAALMIGVLTPTLSSAQPGNSNSKKSKQLVLLHADPGTYNGPCPGEINFTGQIHGAPGDTIIVTWTDSDSTEYEADTIVLDSRGKATVEMTMSVGSEGDTTWSQGWVELTAMYGDGSETTSKPAHWRVKCNQNSNRDQHRNDDEDGSDLVSVSVSPDDYEGPCPTTITFTGTIEGEAGDTVFVDWNRSDGATGTTDTIVIDSTGTATVESTWTLGGDGSEIEGWQSLTVTYPDGTTETSEEAEFEIKCDDPTSASLSVSPDEYEGPCPTTITFTGAITGDAGDSVMVDWIRSDGATSPTDTVVIDSTGNASVESTWTLGGNGSEIEGWQAMVVTWPDGTSDTTERAEFEIDCDDSTESDDGDLEDRPLKINIRATPGAHVGPCPGTINFTAMILGAPGDTVTVQWNRSDGATAPTETVVLDEDGKATVTTTWTLGGDALPEYEGWQSLTLTTADGEEVTSREAKFKVKCKDNARANGQSNNPNIE